ncbi:MAG: CHAT domain-containing protein [Bacteroidetes bacterium]|nr:CHAT domain-containing protein [Bacteroidota bacterium]
MKRCTKNIVVIFSVILFVSGTWGGTQNIISFNELKAKITKVGFSPELFKRYDFYASNNGLDYESELKFLNDLKDSFENQYLQAVLHYRLSNYSQSFILLKRLLPLNPEYFPYYDLLAKTARINNSESDLLANLTELKSGIYKSYLLASIAFNQAEFSHAMDLLQTTLKNQNTPAEILYLASYIQRNLGDYNTALKHLVLAENVSPIGKEVLAKIQNAKGSLFYLSGDYKTARKNYEDGFRISSETKYTTEKIKSIFNLAIIDDVEGNVESARVQFNKAITIADEINEFELLAISYSELAVSFTYTNEIIAARKAYEKSYELFTKLNNKVRVAFLATNIGNLFLGISNYKSALEYYNIGLSHAGENKRAQMLSFMGIGDVYTNLSNYSSALSYYEKSKKIAKEIKDAVSDVKINIGIGVLYYNLNMIEEALKIFKGEANKIDELGDPFLMSELYQKMGIIYYGLDSLKIASDYLDKSGMMSKINGDPYSELYTKTYESLVKMKENKFKEAFKIIKKNISITEEYELSHLLSFQKLILGDFHYQLKEIDSALHNWQESLNLAKEVIDHDFLIEINYKIAGVYLERKKKKLAEEYLLNSIESIEDNSRLFYQKAEMQIKYFSNYQDIYDTLTELYLAEERIDEALGIMDRARSRNTKQNLAQFNILDSSLGKEELSNLYDLEWKQSHNILNHDESEQFHAFKRALMKKNPSLEKIFNVQGRHGLFLEKMRKEISINQSIITYYLSDKYSFVFRIGKNDFTYKKLNVGRDEISEYVLNISPYYREDSHQSEIYFNKDLFAFDATASYALYKAILEPILSPLPKESTIIFSLPRELQILPFELLVTKDPSKSGRYFYSDKTFLINDFTVSYTPSIGIWDDLRKRKSTTSDKPLLMGNPSVHSLVSTVSDTRGLSGSADLYLRGVNMAELKFSEEEVLRISDILGNSDVFISGEATETVFKERAKDASIIHLSTHSILYDEKPVIIFSQNDSENDGFLELGEIADLKINSEMVVLSSCKSGLGSSDRSEGIIGMQKAFMESGTNSIVVSLWDVSDEHSSKLMEFFYSFLNDGNGKSESLRLAKLKFISEENANPYYWAAFTLSGNNSPIKLTKSFNWRYLFIILTITSALLMLIYLLMRKYSGVRLRF